MSDSGLKRRNVAAAGALSSSGNDAGRTSDNPDADSNPDNDIDEQNEEFDADSKSTRLTLMEEILLLGLKDKEVSIILLISSNDLT